MLTLANIMEKNNIKGFPRYAWESHDGNDNEYRLRGFPFRYSYDNRGSRMKLYVTGTFSRRFSRKVFEIFPNLKTTTTIWGEPFCYDHVLSQKISEDIYISVYINDDRSIYQISFCDQYANGRNAPQNQEAFASINKIIALIREYNEWNIDAIGSL